MSEPYRASSQEGREQAQGTEVVVNGQVGQSRQQQNISPFSHTPGSNGVNAASRADIEQEEPSPVSSTRDGRRNERERNVPPWFQPFFSLRAQLTFTTCLVLILVVTVLYVFFSQHPSASLLGIVSVGAVVVGTLLVFVLNTLLLSPLWHVTDTAQALALGDFKQRQRLQLRLPPQDEIDRLSGSLDEMVTRLEHAEEMQCTSEQRFQRLISDASHQLRTPLTSLRGFTDLLMRGAKDDPETSPRILKLMKNEAERMTYLINDLLTLSRLDDGRPLKTQYVDLVAVANDRVEYARARAQDDREIVLSVADQGPIGVQGNEEYLKQLLFILLDNALKYGRPAPNGRVAVEVDKENGHAIIRVSDNGDGISEEDLSLIFDSFYRGRHDKQGPVVIGTGLGLTIASAIVRAHKGSIEVASSANSGTVFTITLPRAL